MHKSTRSQRRSTWASLLCGTLLAAAAAVLVSAQQQAPSGIPPANVTALPAAGSTAGGVKSNATGRSAAAAAEPMFDTIFTAAITLNETRRIKDAFAAVGAAGITPDLVARYQNTLGLMQNGDATLTAFFPNELAWQRETAWVCMSTDEQMAYLVATPNFGADSWLAFLFNTSTPVFSKDFRDGMVLKGIKPGFEVVLRNRTNPDGSTSWYLPGVSPNGSDVNIVSSDITAGRGIVHLTDNIVSDKPLREHHAQLRKAHEANCSKYAAAAAPAAASSGAVGSRGLGLIAGGLFGLLQLVVCVAGMLSSAHLLLL